jgi:hypothetical protein
MKFHWTDEVPVPLPDLWEARRDRVFDLVPHMKNVIRIERRGTERHANGVVQTHHRWYGSPEEIPLIFRPIIPAEMLWWTEHTHWNPSNFTCTWTIDLPALPEVVTAKGINRYEADGKTTRVDMQGEFTVHADRLPPVPGVPPILVRQAAPRLETWVVKLLEPNLKEANRAVERFLSQRRS